MDFLKLVYGGSTGAGFKGPAVDSVELEKLQNRLEEADKWLRQGIDEGNDGFGWLKLPYQQTEHVFEFGNWLGNFEHVVQIGIGGSALGNLMLRNALVHPYYNEIPLQKRKRPAFYVADNVDPHGSKSILDVVDISRTALIVVSKSGSTAETMANFLYFFHQLELAVGASMAPDHVLVITDESRGSLRAFAKDTGCRSLTIPSGVGGRYSVLSAVGLVSAVAMGIDIENLLEGAGEVDKKLNSRKVILDNPAWILSALHYLHYRKGRNIDVLMPYSDRLEDFVEWYAQLCAESLGKQGQGFTPVRALGSIDQHSQVQLYTEGPDDKLFTIIEVKRTDNPISIPGVNQPSLKELSYLYEKEMGQMLSYEAMATAAAIYRSGKPVLWIEVEEISPRTLGGMIFFFEYVVALTGRLLEIDPFDQPGVEQGKRYTYGFMGRKGYSEHRREAEDLFHMMNRKSIEL